MKFTIIENPNKKEKNSDGKPYKYKVLMSINGKIDTFSVTADCTIEPIVQRYKDKLFEYETAAESLVTALDQEDKT